MVFDDHSEAGEVVAEFVRAREIAVVARLLPFGEESVDVRVGCGDVRTLQVMVRGGQVGESDREDVFEYPGERGELAAGECVVAGCCGDYCERSGGIEVVADRVVERVEMCSGIPTQVRGLSASCRGKSFEQATADPCGRCPWRAR